MTSEQLQNSFRTALEPSLKDIIDLPKSQYSIRDIIGRVTKQQIILIVLVLFCFVFREITVSIAIEIWSWMENIMIEGGIVIARALIQPCMSVTCA